jgi:hypothetical protein
MHDGAGLASGGWRERHEDLQGSIGWQREHPGAKSPSTRTASASAEADKRLGGNTLVILRYIEGPTSDLATADPAVCESDADPQHAHRSPVNPRLDVLRTMGVHKDCHVDPESVREHIQVGDGHDGVLSLAQQRIDCQRGGQRAFRRPIPGGG